jgi:hypothetical protein
MGFVRMTGKQFKLQVRKVCRFAYRRKTLRSKFLDFSELAVDVFRLAALM